MGGGVYDGEAHKAITTARRALPKEEVFRQTHCHPDMDPSKVKGGVRESRDSANHPNSLAIKFGLDETGSMHGIPVMLAKEELPHFMETIEDFGVQDPQVMFSAIGDARNGERSPLQVGQYESEAHLMDRWLTLIHLEGQGGGNNGESYDLDLYFSARHTAMDCWEKRGRKGYHFITGDEPPFSHVTAKDVQNVIGVTLEDDIPLVQIVKEVRKMFHPFFLIPDLQRRSYQGCERVWRDLLGDHVICMETPRDTCLVSASLVGITEGVLADLDAVGRKLQDKGRDKTQVNRVIRAIEPYAATLEKGQRRPAEPVEPKGRGRKK